MLADELSNQLISIASKCCGQYHIRGPQITKLAGKSLRFTIRAEGGPQALHWQFRFPSEYNHKILMKNCRYGRDFRARAKTTHELCIIALTRREKSHAVVGEGTLIAYIIK